LKIDKKSLTKSFYQTKGKEFLRRKLEFFLVSKRENSSKITLRNAVAIFMDFSNFGCHC